MSQDYGIPASRHGGGAKLRTPARWLVVIDAAGSTVARLFSDKREPLGEFDAGTEEVAVMTRGLAAQRSAGGTEWDAALDGHSKQERDSADVYTLDV